MTAQDVALPTSINEVKGWFPRVDQRMFSWCLERQESQGIKGDLLELGCYLGKSAILIGRHVREGETFTVCDLFDSPASDTANQREMSKSYASLTRAAFEANYLAFHGELPTILQGLTSMVPDHVKPDTCRFVHIDASHLYEHVRGDLEAGRAIARDDAIVVCDDYRSEHTPGVAAAVWEAVATTGLRPICLTTQKLYATWGDPDPVRDELLEWLAGEDDLWHEVQEVGGRPLVRVKDRRPGNSAEVVRKDAELRQARERLERTERQLTVLKEDLKMSRLKADALRSSVSFKAGRVLTAPPRAMRRLSRKG